MRPRYRYPGITPPFGVGVGGLGGFGVPAPIGGALGGSPAARHVANIVAEGGPPSPPLNTRIPYAHSGAASLYRGSLVRNKTKPSGSTLGGFCRQNRRNTTHNGRCGSSVAVHESCLTRQGLLSQPGAGGLSTAARPVVERRSAPQEAPQGRLDPGQRVIYQGGGLLGAFCLATIAV